jgi:O-methyltransferase involved in polyketide biosynthesis
MAIATTALTPVEQTAFLTGYARALDSRWSRPILGDTLADEVVRKIDYDFAGLGVQTSVVCQAALRAKMLDDRVRAFIEKHPDAVVVDLGAGLDSGFYRVDPPISVDCTAWISRGSWRCATTCCRPTHTRIRFRYRWPKSSGRKQFPPTAQPY